MGRKPIALDEATLIAGIEAFEAGESNRRISLVTNTSQKVWEREFRAALGDAAFEHRLAQNKQKHKTTKPQENGWVPPARSRPGSSGKTVQVVCIESGEAFGSLKKAAVALSVPYHQVRNSLLGKGPAITPKGEALSFRRWRKGDPDVEARPERKAIPLRFEDGQIWPSVTSLAKSMGAEARHVTRFCRRLKELGYGPGAPPLELKEMLLMAELMPILQRKQLEDKIRLASR